MIKALIVHAPGVQFQHELYDAAEVFQSRQHRDPICISVVILLQERLLALTEKKIILMKSP